MVNKDYQNGSGLYPTGSVSRTDPSATEKSHVVYKRQLSFLYKWVLSQTGACGKTTDRDVGPLIAHYHSIQLV